MGGWFNIIVLGLLAAGIIVAAVVMIRYYMRQQAGPSNAVFKSLCSGNGLNRAEVRALKKIATAYEMADPAMLFFRRSLFESGAGTVKLDSVLKKSLTGKMFS